MTSDLFKRYVIPLAAPRTKEVGKKLLCSVVKTGTEVVGEVVSGKNAKEAMKERGLAGIKRRSATACVSHLLTTTESTLLLQRRNAPNKLLRKEEEKNKVIVKPNAKSKDIFG